MASLHRDPTDLTGPLEPGPAAATDGPSPTGVSAGATPACSFEIVLADGTRERIEDADAYQQEQSMTTFFRTDGRRQTVDCWSVRVASFRTEHIVAVRRHDRPAGARHLQSV